MAFDTNSTQKPASRASSSESASSEVRNNFRMRVMPGNTLEEAPKSSVKEPMIASRSLPSTTVPRKLMVGGVVGAIVLGLVSGGAAAYLSAQSVGTAADVEQTASEQEVANAVKVGAVFGVPDEKTFRDDTEGVIIIGGLDGEGSHTLLRPGGVSQNVYLTSSVVDLDQFEGAKIRIWGETFKGQKAGWLMDVGRVEVLELNASKPEWYEQQNKGQATKNQGSE